MDLEKEIQELKAKLEFNEQVILETSAPITSSIVEDTILIPIIGYTGQERFKSIRTRILEYIGLHRETDCAVFDFTGIQDGGVIDIDYNILIKEIGQLNSSLKLMGVRPIYVGFNPRLVREIVNAGFHVEIETYVNFKSALLTVLSENEKSLHSI